jgi:hypothetical protein
MNEKSRECGQLSVSRNGSEITIQLKFSMAALTPPAINISSYNERKDILIPIKKAPDTALVSASTLNRMKNAGELPYVKIRGRVFFHESALLAIRQEIRLKGASI